MVNDAQAVQDQGASEEVHGLLEVAGVDEGE